MALPPVFQTTLTNQNSNNVNHVTVKNSHVKLMQNIGPSYQNGPWQADTWKSLKEAVAPGAFHDSGERFPPPQCHPGTRVAVTKRIMDWIYGKESTESFIIWLHSAAGAGKSAIAQRIAEQCHKANILLASYFASNRADPRRMDANYIIPTIAYQISLAIPTVRPLIEDVITHDPLIFTRTLEAQMIALIVKPLQLLAASGCFTHIASSPRLIIIDGLDEIRGHNAGVKVLEVICHALHHHHLPLIFLIASRPEQDIAHTFSMEPLSSMTTQLLLDETYDPHYDIRVFLTESFSKIKNSHHHKSTIPPDWPPWGAIDHLVIKASGQFIYPSTVVRFVESTQHRPTDQLDIILGICPLPLNESSPYGELDALYLRILSVDSVRKYWDQIAKILGVLLTAHPRVDGKLGNLPHIEKFLGFRRGDCALYLANMTSLISMDPEIHFQNSDDEWFMNDSWLRNEEKHHSFQILHASFHDFLLDPTRSGEFSLSEKSMNTMMACCCLQQLRTFPKQNLTEYSASFHYASRYTVHHITLGYPNEEVLGLFQTVSIQDILDHCWLHSTNVSDILWGIWTLIFKLVGTLSTWDLDQSMHHNLQSQHFDQVIKHELDVRYSWHPSLSFLLCLLKILHHDRGAFLVLSFPCLMQLIGWYSIPTPKGLTTQSKWDDPPFIVTAPYIDEEANILHDFLQDALRSGKYAVTAETYANASVSCLKYLCCGRLGPPINLHHTPRNLARRRNSPWNWNRYRKLMSRLPVVSYEGKRRASITLPTIYRDFDGREQALSMCENLKEQVERHQQYTGTTRLGMDFLRHTLPLSGPSDELIALLRADKSFSQRAMQFPRRLKKCKAAIATYLARVELKTEPTTSENEGETTLASDELEILPAGEEGVLLHDRDMSLAERWSRWIARGKMSGVGAEQADGRWGSLGYILKFLLPIFLSFILSAVVSYFS